MRVALLIIISLNFNYVFASDIVPEPILKSWGYESTKIIENEQDIKRIKGNRWSSGQIYYPRFKLTKKCFDSTEDAAENDKSFYEELKSDPFKGSKSYYNSFISDACVFSISTGANHTFLEYQPALFEKYKMLISGANSP